MNMYYTYLLQSLKDNGFYIGYTHNLRHRFEQHTNGEVDATMHRRPVKLFYYEAYETATLAQERERKLKQFGSAYVALLKRLDVK